LELLHGTVPTFFFGSAPAPWHGDGPWTLLMFEMVQM
jgi:hypothetical protein